MMMAARSSGRKRLKSEEVKGEGSFQGSSVDQDKQIPMVEGQTEGSIKVSEVDEDSRQEEEEEEEEEDVEEEEEEEDADSFQESEDEDQKSRFRESWNFDPESIVFDEEFTDKQKKEYCHYHNEMRQTEGFGVTSRPDCVFWGSNSPSPVEVPNSSPETQKFLDDLACYAMNRYNEIKGESLKFKDVQKAAFYGCAGFMFYITFRAFDSQDELKTFETKVLDGVHRRKVYIFRPKKSPPQV